MICFASLQVIQHLFYHLLQLRKIFLTNTINFISIYIKIMMYYYITYTHYMLPWNFRILNQQFFICLLIQIFNAFPDCSQFHADTVHFHHATFTQ